MKHTEQDRLECNYILRAGKEIHIIKIDSALLRLRQRFKKLLFDSLMVNIWPR